MATHVMCSYNWDYQTLVLKLGAILKSQAVDTWIDIQGSSCLGKMAGSTDEMMSKAVNRSSHVLVFVTKKYLVSQNCMQELKFARQMEKQGNLKIIYIMLERDCTPFSKGSHAEHLIWMYMGDQLFYGCYSEDDIQKTAEELLLLLPRSQPLPVKEASGGGAASGPSLPVKEESHGGAESKPSSQAAAAARIAGKPGILQAVDRGDKALVEDHLIADPACISQRGGSQDTLLHVAAWKGHTIVSQVLVGAGSDLNATDKDKYNPLHYSAEKGHVDLTKVLLGAKANVNARGKEKDTPLHLACWKGHLAVCQALVEAKADLAARDKDGESPLGFAIDCKKADVAAFLRSIGAPQ